MTLKEKFNNLVPIEFGGMQEPLLTNCEKIADEFALGFLHWHNISQECETYLRKNYPKNITMNGEHYKKVLEVYKELLKIYKKEKGL